MRAIFTAIQSALFILGLALLIILGLSSPKGVYLSIITLILGELIIYFSFKYRKNTPNTHAPLLFSFAMSGLLLTAFFIKDIPGRIHPTLLCWSISIILEILYWFYDKQYEKADIRQLLKTNLRFPPIVDVMIVAVNIKGISCGELNKSIWLYIVLVLVAAFDFFRQIPMIIRKEISPFDIFG